MATCERRETLDGDAGPRRELEELRRPDRERKDSRACVCVSMKADMAAVNREACRA